MTNKSIRAANHSTQNLFKILIGAAWLDGKVQRQEQDYLSQLAKVQGVADDPEIYPLLHGLRKVSTTECYQTIQDYLGDQPTAEDCQDLIEALSGLIYSDSEVGTEEAKLLTKIQEIELTGNVAAACSANMPDLIQRLYQRWVTMLDEKLPG
jgi:uncharacterized tellurite resistance protein B-like protein